MACFRPFHVKQVGINPETGKRNLLFLRYGDKHYNDPDVIEVPCGRCQGCRLDRSRKWADRCLLELQYHESAVFVTLTYNDIYVPKSTYYGSDDESLHMSYSLRKRDFQLFMKRLRKAFPDQKIRFFAAGEYGESTARPHYHAILFGLKLDDMVPFQKTDQGFWYYHSGSLQRVWSKRLVDNLQGSVTPLAVYQPLGDVIVADVSWNTCAYTARYCLKKLNGQDAEAYRRFGVEPPFNLMSRSPGIGGKYFEEHPDCVDFQYINVRTEDGGRKVVVPDYFLRLLEKEDPEKVSGIKESRMQYAKAAKQIVSASTDLSEDWYAEVLENKKRSSVRALTRKV